LLRIVPALQYSYYIWFVTHAPLATLLGYPNLLVSRTICQSVDTVYLGIYPHERTTNEIHADETWASSAGTGIPARHQQFRRGYVGERSPHSFSGGCELPEASDRGEGAGCSGSMPIFPPVRLDADAYLDSTPMDHAERELQLQREL
jgi:hypothetical protein